MTFDNDNENDANNDNGDNTFSFSHCHPKNSGLNAMYFDGGRYTQFEIHQNTSYACSERLMFMYIFGNNPKVGNNYSYPYRS